jgi:hypothetical protein
MSKKIKLPSATFHVQVTMRTKSGQDATPEQVKDASYAQNLCMDQCSVVVQRVKCIFRAFNLSHGMMSYHVTVRQMDACEYYNNPDGIATPEELRQDVLEWIMFWPGKGWNDSPKITVSHLMHSAARPPSSKNHD